MIKRAFLCFSACIFAWAFSGNAVLAANEMTTGQSLKEQITGPWMIAPNKQISTGTLEFKAGGTYEMNQTDKDGSSAGTKGEFKLDESTTPVRLRLCLGACNQPGAEWVTRFCIIRLTSPTTMEIFQSTDGSYPGAFPEDKEAENYLILTRK